MINTDPINDLKDDLFNRKDFVSRLVGIVLNKQTDSKLIGMYARWGSGKTSTLNLCRQQAELKQNAENDEIIKSYWVSPFETWQMESMGDLRISLLWHLRNQLPEKLINDESILYRIGRVGVALSIVGLNVTGKLAGTSNLGTDIIKGLEAADHVLPIGDTITSSSTFATAEQSSKVTAAFDSLGDAVCKALDVDKVIVPIDDMDRCSDNMHNRSYG